MKRSLALPVAAVVAAGGFAAIPAAVPAFTSPAQAASEDDRSFDDEVAQQMLVQINEHRESQGLEPLTRSLALDGIAQPWAESMADKQKLSHNPGSSTKIFATGATGAAENVAQNNRGDDAAATAKALVDSLLDSSGHRKNIEGDYNAIGVGFAVAENGQTYASQNFAHYDGAIPEPASGSAGTSNDDESDDSRSDREKSDKHKSDEDSSDKGSWNKDGKDKAGKHADGKDEDKDRDGGEKSDDRSDESGKSSHESDDSDSDDDADSSERGLVIEPEQLTAEEFVEKDDSVLIKASGLKAGSEATVIVKKDDGSVAKHTETREVDDEGTVTFAVHGKPTDDISGYEGRYSVTVKAKGGDSLEASFTVGSDDSGDDANGKYDDEKSGKDGSKADKHDGKYDDEKSHKDDSKSDKHDGKSDKDDSKSDKHDGKSDKDDSKSDKHDGKSDKDDSKSDKDEAKAGSDAAAADKAAGEGSSADDAAGAVDVSDDDAQGGNDAHTGGDDAAATDDEAAGNPGALPRTGPELAGAGLGAALLAIGGVTVMLTRRRLG